MKDYRKAIVLYMPVLHQGYVEFLSSFEGLTQIFLLDRSVTHVYRPFQKDIRALPVETMVAAVNSMSISALPAESIGRDSLLSVLNTFDEIYMPDEDISREIHEMFPEKVVLVNTFLRWDSSNAKAHKEVASANEVVPDEEMTELIANCLKEADRSADIYRQVAAAVFKRGEFCISLHNRIVPSIHTLFYEGDPRGQFKKGVEIELSLALHAEAGTIAESARRGLSLDGAEMFCTDFPCPPCAKLIAYCGVVRVYYLKGYAVLDGERILRDRSIEICKIKNA